MLVFFRKKRLLELIGLFEFLEKNKLPTSSELLSVLQFQGLYTFSGPLKF